MQRREGEKDYLGEVEREEILSRGRERGGNEQKYGAGVEKGEEERHGEETPRLRQARHFAMPEMRADVLNIGDSS